MMPIPTGRLVALRRVVAVAFLSTAVAFVAARLIAALVVPMVSDVPVDQAMLAAGLVAVLVTAPMSLLLFGAVAKLERQRRLLAGREEVWKSVKYFAKVGHWDFDVRNDVFTLSGNVHEMLGDPDRTLRMTRDLLLEMAHPEDRGPLVSALGRLVETGQTVAMEFRITGLDGIEKTFWTTGGGVPGADGRPVRIAGACQDITERKALEAALQESAEHYRHAVELSPLIAWTEDENGDSLDLDAGWLALTGLTEEEARAGGWIKCLHPDDLAVTEEAWSRCTETREPYDVTHRMRVADGSYRWFRTRATARLDEKGHLIRWYGTVEDIHERVTAETALRESEAFARSILDSSSNCVEVVNLDGRVQFMNKPGLAMMEIDDFSRFKGQIWVDLWPRAARADVLAAMAAAQEGRTVTFTSACPTAKGSPRWWETCLSPIPGADGRPGRLLSTARDVTEAKAAQDALDQSRKAAEDNARRLAAVLESTTDSVIILDTDWRISFLNDRAAEMMSLGQEVTGTSIWRAMAGDGGNFEHRVRGAVARQEVAQFEEFHPPLGIWLEVHVFPSVDGVSIFFRDVSRRREAQEQLLYLSRHDSLTGLPNRTMLREQLDAALRQATRRSQTALLFLDLDEFKSVNDTWGHPAGDRLLVEAAGRLRSCVRDGDKIARLGGDEFAVIQTGLKRREDVRGLALRIIGALSEPYDIDGRPVLVGVSIGIAAAADPSAQADLIIKDADVALYRAKADGRGIYRFFEPGMEPVGQSNQGLRADLRKALGRSELSLAFQPLVNFDSGRVIGMEALLRWEHPVLGQVPPSEFIPVAEETGVIVPIGTWVLNEACQAAAAWPEHVSVSVNLSPVQVRRPGLVQAVSRCLKASGLSARRLQLEVTETVLLQDVSSTLEVLHALRGLGVRIAMDDFGTGYSSLSYLRTFPFDSLKIDRSFVADMAQNHQTNAIVRAVVELGNSLGVETTAEGVETRRQLEELRRLGCREGQGYLFSPPVGGADVAALIERLDGQECAAA